MTRMQDQAETKLIAQAASLHPALRERAQKGRELRRLPDETVLELRELGLFHLLVPRIWGGREAPLETLFEIQLGLASVCPSTAWVMGVFSVQGWQLALFPVEAQREVWGEDQRALVCSSYAPTGTAEAVTGGYLVSGRWSFSSGCDHASWVLLGGRAPELCTFLVPRSEYRIEDTWHVAGLQATGSKDIVVTHAFVPLHRVLKFVDGFSEGKSPGNATNTGPLYRVPFGQIFARTVSTTAVGAALGALGAYRQASSVRIGAVDQVRVAKDPNAQAHCAHAAALLDEARETLFRDVAEVSWHAEREQALSLERRAQFRFNAANAVRKAVLAVDALVTATGSRAIFLDNPIQGFFQDVHAAQAHFVNRLEKPAQNYGGMLLGEKNQDLYV